MEETLNQILNPLKYVGSMISAYDRGYVKEELWGEANKIEAEVLELYAALPEEMQAECPTLAGLGKDGQHIIGSWNFAVDEVEEILAG